MSQARIATGKTLRGRMLCVLLLLALAGIWHTGAGARSQQPPREERGTYHLSIHPDEGLRQIAHIFQKRQGDDRKPGALPEPLVLRDEVELRPERGRATRISLPHEVAPAAAPRRVKLARAPPLDLA